jgi:hypothetical protein
MTNKLPAFLVIGSAKSGTTSLCADLACNPRISFGADKEPHFLTRHGESVQRIIARYQLLYRASPGEVAFGDGSTGYSKYPHVLHVPAVARAVLGSELRLIYIVRNPVERIISQYIHEFSVGAVKESIDLAVVKYGRFIDTSCYYLQLKEWLRLFPRKNVLVLKFENYFANREAEYAKVNRFLSVSCEGVRLDNARAENARHSTKRFSGLLRKLQRSPAYRQARMYLPNYVRGMPGDVARWFVGKAAPPIETTLSTAVRRYLAYRMNDEIDRFARVAGVDVTDWRLSVEDE